VLTGFQGTRRCQKAVHYPSSVANCYLHFSRYQTLACARYISFEDINGETVGLERQVAAAQPEASALRIRTLDQIADRHSQTRMFRCRRRRSVTRLEYHAALVPLLHRQPCQSWIRRLVKRSESGSASMAGVTIRVRRVAKASPDTMADANCVQKDAIGPPTSMVRPIKSIDTPIAMGKRPNPVVKVVRKTGRSLKHPVCVAT